MSPPNLPELLTTDVVESFSEVTKRTGVFVPKHGNAQWILEVTTNEAAEYLFINDSAYFIFASSQSKSVCGT
jgi:hypothetical protein